MNKGRGGATSVDDDAQRPFVGLTTWIDRSTLSRPNPGEELQVDDAGAYRRVERKICGSGGGLLTVRERAPQERGWDTREGTHVVTVADGALARSVVRFLLRVVHEAGEGTVHFTSSRRASVGTDRRTRLERDASTAEREAADHARQAAAFRAMAAAALGQHDDMTSDDALKAAQPYQEDAAEAARSAEAASATAASLRAEAGTLSGTREVELDLTQLSVLGPRARSQGR